MGVCIPRMAHLGDGSTHPEDLLSIPEIQKRILRWGCAPPNGRPGSSRHVERSRSSAAHSHAATHTVPEPSHDAHIDSRAHASRGGSQKPRAALLRVAQARVLPSPPAYYFPTHERTCSWLLHCYTMIWAVLDAPKRKGSREARMTCWFGGVGDRRPLQRWLPRHERCRRAIL